MIAKKTVFSLGLVCAVCLCGCGYTSQTVLPNNIRTIYIDTVVNDVPIADIYAYVPGLEMDITQAIIERIHQDGNLKIVPREEADAILEASLTGLEQEGLRFTSLESVEEFRLFLVLSMRLLDGRTEGVIWTEPNFSGDAEYFVSDVRSISREEGVQRAVQRLARNVVDRIVEDW